MVKKLDEWEQDLADNLKDPEFAEYFGADRAKSAFGSALAKARKVANLTQRQLAEKLKVTQPYIAQLENGEGNPTLEMVGKIFAMLGLRIAIEVEPIVPANPSAISVANHT